MSRNISDEDIHRAAIAGLAELGIKVEGQEAYEEHTCFQCGCQIDSGDICERCKENLDMEDDCSEVEEDPMCHMNEALEVIDNGSLNLTARYLGGEEWREESKSDRNAYANRKG